MEYYVFGHMILTAYKNQSYVDIQCWGWLIARAKGAKGVLSGPNTGETWSQIHSIMFMVYKVYRTTCKHHWVTACIELQDQTTDT